MMTRMQLNPARERLIYGFFETYLILTEEEEEQLMEEVGRLSKESEEFIKNLPISYEEKGKEIGKKEVALEMLKKELDSDLIVEVTQLDREEIEGLKKQL